MKPFVVDDTIVAIATAPGEGAIGIVRLSGPRSLELAQRFFVPQKKYKNLPAFRTTLGNFIVDGEKIDQGLFIYYPSPHSYTGEEVVEIQGHGSPVTLRRIVQTLLAAGARLAEPGEFTKRAFLNGKIDLAQAEAVATLIAAKTELAARASLAQLDGSLSRQVEELRQQIVNMFVYVEAAIDYPEEDLELLSGGQLRQRAQELVARIRQIREGARSGKILQQGIQAVIVGKPNVGKSSLLNALLNEERSIVTPVPGTTRDTVSEFASLDGIPVKFIDTAGIRESSELVEQEGVRRSRQSLEAADVVLFICDGSAPFTDEDQQILSLTHDKNTITVINKIDLPQQKFPKALTNCVVVSAKERTGLELLRKAIVESITQSNGFFSHEHYMINLRHEEALRQAEESLLKAGESLSQGLSGEFVAVDLRAALDALGEIVGLTTADDILDKIFSTFCIGK